ncbi:MAG: InlB B-repeat-containing protein [Phycisphaerae bacterium]|nr:InlB B-repeat-containing protein [Phycisphaerae bacterium]
MTVKRTHRLSLAVCGLTTVLLCFMSAAFGAEPGRGKILFEYWSNVGGTAVADLTSYPDYPESPSFSELRDAFDSHVDWADNFGTRVRGYVYPAQTGNYTFWIAGDDFCELYLSTDADPAHARQIATVPGYTAHRQWTLYWAQQSAPIFLKAGPKYYIEALHKECYGGDSVSVAWGGPGIGAGPVLLDGAYLSPFVREGPANGESFVVIDDMESYTDDTKASEAIFQTWIDGWTNGTGSSIGNLIAPFAEQTCVHGGKQSMPFDYDNASAPFYSETSRDFSPLQNWTAQGMSDLVLFVKGRAASVAESGGPITVTAGGTDIWDYADAFRLVYRRLTGDGSITARVDSLTRSSDWSKAGVMIRESLSASSKHAMVVVTPDHGVAFQRRTSTNDLSTNDDIAGPTTPYWVRLTRTGNVFKAERSADGLNWSAVGSSQTISMTSGVYTGLAVTSHNAGGFCAAVFSHVTTTQNPTSPWQVADIGADPQPGNTPAPMYVAVQDSAGRMKTIKRTDSKTTVTQTWQEWRIPLSSFTGVDASKIRRMFIGIGDREYPAASGSGRIYVDDIRCTTTSKQCSVTISSTEGGDVCLPTSGMLQVITPISDGTYEYACGTEVMFYAQADHGYRFVRWTGTVVDAGKIDPTSSFVTFTVDGQDTLMAHFEKEATGSCSVTISSTAGGDVCLPTSGMLQVITPIPDGTYSSPCGTEVLYYAVADQGYHFVRWTGTLVDTGKVDSTSPSARFTLDGQDTLRAQFEKEATGSCSVTISSTTGGAVYVLGGDVWVPRSGALKYPCGTRVSVSPRPYAGYYFVNWTGTAVTAGKVADPASASTTVTVDADCTLSANFAPGPPPGQYTLTVSISPSSAGSVTCSPSKVTYASGEQVTLTAVPASGYRLRNWAGALFGSTTNPATLTMDANKSVTAVFEAAQTQYTLVTAYGGAGSLTRTPNKSTYTPGEQVTLTATPAAGYRFKNWSGDLTGSTNPATIIMNSNKSVTAYFEAVSISYSLTVTISPPVSGAVNCSPNKATYAPGEQVTLTAFPASGCKFKNWSGALSGSTNPATLTMDANKSVTAVFEGTPIW